MLSSLELHFQVPPCMMIQVTPSPTNQTWRCNLSLHHSLVLCGHLHAWASRIAFQISSWYGNQKFESFKQFWDSGCNTVLNHGQTHTKHGDARTCWGTNDQNTQFSKGVLNHRLLESTQYEQYIAGSTPRSTSYELKITPRWWAPEKWVVWNWSIMIYTISIYSVYIYMYVCTNIYIYIY